MTDDRFNELIAQLMLGMPVTIVVNRLVLALRVLVGEDADPKAEETFEQYVASCWDDS